nr:hypothetical protein [Tanacetum cinerariifolium]
MSVGGMNDSPLIYKDWSMGMKVCGGEGVVEKVVLKRFGDLGSHVQTIQPCPTTDAHYLMDHVMLPLIKGRAKRFTVDGRRPYPQTSSSLSSTQSQPQDQDQIDMVDNYTLDPVKPFAAFLDLGSMYAEPGTFRSKGMVPSAKDAAHMIAASKVPMLKPGELELWRMRIDQNEVTARSTLMMGLPNEHQLKFNSFKDAKTLLAAIEKRFGGNDATKKTQRNLLKQQYENFSGSSSESLDQIFDKLQKLVSQLELLGEVISQEDINQKFLRSLPMNEVYESEVKRISSSTNTQNMAFVPSSLNNSNSSNGVNTAQGVNTANGVNTASSQPNSTQLVHEDLEQIHPDDLEEMDLKWQMAMLTMRAKRFLKNIGRKLNLNENDSVAFDKTKVECYNYHKKATLKDIDALIIKDWVSDDEEEEVKQKEVKPSINRINFVKATKDNNPKEIVNNGEQPKQNTHRKRGNQRNWNGMMSHRPFNVVHPKRTMNVVNQESYFSKQVNTARPKAAVDAAKAKAKHKGIKGKRGNAVKASACWVWKPKHNVLDHVFRHSSASITLKKFDYVDGNPQEHLQDKGVIDSGCSRHMTVNMSFLTYYEEIDGGYVAFRGIPKGGKITGK